MPEGEIRTDEMLEQALHKDGKVIYVPRVGLDFEKCDMDLVRVDESKGGESGGVNEGGMFYKDWPRNKWGIPEPPVDDASVAQPGDIDLLVVPGLAFDWRGHRLGQGKGYYDRFIARMRDEKNSGNEKKPILVAVCLEDQFLREDEDIEAPDNLVFQGVPVSEHDYVMDVVLTPSATIMFQR